MVKIIDSPIYQNKISLGEDGLIHVEYIGVQNSESIKEDMRQMTKFILELHQQHKQAYMLSNLGGITKQDSTARREGYKALMVLPYDKIAFFWAGLFLKHLTNLVVKAAGISQKAHFFNSEEEAIAWLRS